MNADKYGIDQDEVCGPTHDFSRRNWVTDSGWLDQKMGFDQTDKTSQPWRDQRDRFYCLAVWADFSPDHWPDQTELGQTFVHTYHSQTRPNRLLCRSLAGKADQRPNRCPDHQPDQTDPRPNYEPDLKFIRFTLLNIKLNKFSKKHWKNRWFQNSREVQLFGGEV